MSVLEEVTITHVKFIRDNNGDKPSYILLDIESQRELMRDEKARHIYVYAFEKKDVTTGDTLAGLPIFVSNTQQHIVKVVK